jgi:acyl-CoA thioesterase-1
MLRLSASAQPKSISEQGGKQVHTTNERLVVCLGASIVQGKISSNFVDALRQRLGAEGYRFVNAGVAGYEAFNVLTHLDTVIDHRPDDIVILVGTNDVTATLSPTLARLSRLTKDPPRPFPAVLSRHDAPNC